MVSQLGNDGARPSAKRRRDSRRGALVVAGAALAGLVLARVIDWRSHAHPR